MEFLRKFFKQLVESSPEQEEVKYTKEEEEPDEMHWDDPWDMLSHPWERPMWRDTDGDGIPDCLDIDPLIQDDEDDE